MALMICLLNSYDINNYKDKFLNLRYTIHHYIR